MQLNTSFKVTAIVLLAVTARAQSPAPTLDTKPAFMQVVTNYTIETKPVIVTNYLTVTNAVVVTNFYNAQGVLLQPVQPAKPPIPGLIPIPQPQPVSPDPAVVKAQQSQAVRDLLTLGLRSTSNVVCTPGSFTNNVAQQIQIPQGVTSLDAKKSQKLLTAMNVTAEKAAPGALALLLNAAGQFQSDDPATIVNGTADAATRAFLDANKGALEPQILALVQRAGLEAKLHDAYNNVMLKGGGLLGAVLGSGPSVDIDAHVTQGLWQAIANQLAAQEAAIRTDPKARATPALRQVFGKPVTP